MLNFSNAKTIRLVAALALAAFCATAFVGCKNKNPQGRLAISGAVTLDGEPLPAGRIDFIGDNGEIVVYSFSSRKFSLIDPIRRLQTEVDVEEIDRFIEQIGDRLSAKKNGFYDFMFKPKFEISRKENEFLFQSHWIDYRVETTDVGAEYLAAYYQFCQDLCKLNVFMNPGSVTPLARGAVNSVLAENSRFAEKISIDVYPKGKMFFNRSIQIQNEHKVALRLSERDRNRIARAMHFAAQFPEIGVDAYYSKVNED
ncbi:MAG: hypothetical protein HUK22_04390 [Thermoguttaceae bacterium]|nr:hypothetical protein [Thermoguttaceae bacterium]